MEQVLNEYFSRKIDKNRFLVSTRCGTSMLLNEKDYRLLNNGQYKYNEKLVKRLLEDKILLNEKNTKETINRIKLHYIQDKSIYMNCIINLTHRCNLNCVYCHANAGNTEEMQMDMDDVTVDAYLDFVFSLPHKNITIEFQGGEPLLRFDKIKYVLSEFNRKKKKYNKKLVNTTIVSNLTLMTEEIADYILKHKVRLSSSLDGPKELHDAQRYFFSGKGSYDKLIYWYDYFKKRGRIVGTMPTITKKSVELGARAIIDEYVKIGRQSIYLRAMNEIGRGKTNDILSPEKQEFAEFLKEAFDYCVFLYDKKNYLIVERNISSLIKNIMFPVKQYMCMRRPCGAALNQFSVTPNGDIYPCDIARSIPQLKTGNVKTSNFSELVLNTLELRTLTQEFQPLCDTCAYSNFCGNCTVATYAKYGNFVAKTPQDFDCYVNKYVLDHLFRNIDRKKYEKYLKILLKSED